MDDRLRGFSPPPWAALGRRDPNHEQAPWRESTNVEDRRNPGWGGYLSAKADQFGHMLAAFPEAMSALGARPASDELMQHYMEDISRSLPRDETPRLGSYDRPVAYAGRADGGSVEERPRSMVQRAWDARPWKGQLDKPVDYGPLAMALGLVHPRLGSAVRDVGMVRSLMNKGETPAVLRDPGVPFGAGRQLETLGAPYAARPGAQPPAGNSNTPAVMVPGQGPIMPVPGNANPAPWQQSAQAPRGNMARYEAELMRLEKSGVPYSEWPSYHAFLRGLD